ncbi:MAG: M81 family metallopeptidase [Rhodospirillales bacterium]
MRIVIAMMKHETNTFSPVPTPLERFIPAFGNSAREIYRGTNTPMAAYIDIAERAGADIVTPIAGAAPPSGPVQRAAFDRFRDAILGAISDGCDALMLDLHGAMVCEHNDDGEGALLEEIRRLKPGLPISVALDLHANITPAMIDNCTVLTGYKTYPHIDMYETGKQAGEILMKGLRGEIVPVIRWGRRPMLPHTLKMGHDEQPMAALIGMAREAEAGGVEAVSVFGGFPLADIPRPGLSVVTMADANRDPKGDHAATVAEKILDVAWDRRAEFVYHAEPLAQSVTRAKKLEDGPILLIDHADNCASGGTQDTTAVLREVMRQGLKDVAVFAICDPEAVAEMVKAGVGATISLKLGGKTAMPSIGRAGEPIDVTGKVRALTDGEFVITSPMNTGTTAYMGRAGVLAVEGIDIVVIENNHEPFDLGCFRSLGIEPTAKRYLLLKSRIHYRAGFKPIAKAIVECDGTGVTTSDYSQFKFTKIERPAYPLDV